MLSTSDLPFAVFLKVSCLGDTDIPLFRIALLLVLLADQPPLRVCIAVVLELIAGSTLKNEPMAHINEQ